MNKKRLVLVNPVNPARTGLTVNESSRFPPYGLGIIAALTPDSWEVLLIDENWEPFQYQPADLVGITAFTASANRAYEIAAVYRQQGTPVVMGGIHASLCPDEAQQYVDTVVIGEAESVWPALIADAETGMLQRVYQGKSTDLTGMPHPRRDLFNPNYMFASIQTSRGCPMDCEFCSVTAFNGRRYRRRPVEDVLDELECIPQKMLFFVDDNIIGYEIGSRQKALALFKGMVERGLDKWWFCQASINFADDADVLDWAGKAGCKMVFLGLEAEDIDALSEVNKVYNLKRGVEYYEEAFQRIHRAGISVLGAFIFGMDSDTPEKLHRRTKFMIRSGVDVMQVTYLTPLPGTRLFDRLQKEDRLLYDEFPKDWEHYDMTEVLHQPLQMEPTTLESVTDDCIKKMYVWPNLMQKAVRTFFNTKDMMAAMFTWQSNINYRNVSLASDS